MVIKFTIYKAFCLDVAQGQMKGVLKVELIFEGLLVLQMY